MLMLLLANSISQFGKLFEVLQLSSENSFSISNRYERKPIQFAARPDHRPEIVKIVLDSFAT